MVGRESHSSRIVFRTVSSGTTNTGTTVETETEVLDDMGESRRRNRTFRSAYTKYNAFDSHPAYKTNLDRRSWFYHGRSVWLVLAVGLICSLSRQAGGGKEHAGLESRNTSAGQEPTLPALQVNEADSYHYSSTVSVPEDSHRVTVLHVKEDDSSETRITFPRYLDYDEHMQHSCPMDPLEKVQTTLIVPLTGDADISSRLHVLCQNVWKTDPIIVLLENASAEMVQELRETVLVSCTHVDIVHVQERSQGPKDDTIASREHGLRAPSTSSFTRTSETTDKAEGIHRSRASYLHNQALSRVKTSHVLILDEYVLPMPGLEDSIHKAYNSIPTDDALAIPSVLTELSVSTIPDMFTCVKEEACRIQHGPAKNWNGAMSPLVCIPSNDFAPHLVLPWCLSESAWMTKDDDDFTVHNGADNHSTDDDADDDATGGTDDYNDDGRNRGGDMEGDYWRRRDRHRRLTRQERLSWQDERLSSQAWRFAQVDQWRYAGRDFWWTAAFVVSQNDTTETAIHNDGTRQAFHRRVVDHFANLPDDVLPFCSP